MSGLVALYIVASILALFGLFVVWSDWRNRKREKHAH